LSLVECCEEELLEGRALPFFLDERSFRINNDSEREGASAPMEEKECWVALDPMGRSLELRGGDDIKSLCMSSGSTLFLLLSPPDCSSLV